jgi:hypothetical protein
LTRSINNLWQVKVISGVHVQNQRVLESWSHALWTVNDVKEKGDFTASSGEFELERLLKGCKLKFEGSFTVKYPHRSCKIGLSKGFFSVTSLTVHILSKTW